MGRDPEAPPASRPTPRPGLTRAEWGLVLVLAAVNFTHIIDFVIIMPLGDRLMSELKITPTQFGYVVSAYGLSSFAANLLASSVTDRFDRKRVLLAMYAGFALSTLFCGLAWSYELLLLSRISAGVFGGLAATAIMSVIGDAFPSEKRGRATGAVMSAFAIASIFGLPAGLALAEWLGRGAPFVALAAVSAGVWATAAAVMPRVRGHLAADRGHPLAEFLAVAREPNHLKAFAFTLSLAGSFMVASFVGPALTTANGWGEGELAVVYLVGGVCTLVAMNVVGRLADRVARRGLFRVFAVATLTTILVVTNLPPVPLGVAVVVFAVYMVVSSARMVPAHAMMLGCAVPRMRGGFVSLQTAVQHLAVGVAPMAAGALMGRGPDGQLTGYPLVGLLGAGVTAVSLVLAGLIRPAVEAPVVVAGQPHPAADAEPEPKPTAV